VSLSSRKEKLKLKLKLKSETLFFALAFANVLFINEWMNFIYPRNKLLLTAPNYGWGLCSLLCFIALVAIAFYGIAMKADGETNDRKKAGWHLLIVVFMIYPVNAIRQTNNFPIKFPWLSLAFYISHLGTVLTIALILVLIAIAGFAIYRFPKYFNFGVKSTGLILTGFLVITCGQGLGEFYRIFFLPVAKMEVQPTSRPRVIFMIFDEMSEEYVAKSSRKGYELPELDRFRRSSIYATKAYAPGHVTRVSIPSYIWGEKIAWEYDVTAEDFSGSYFNVDQTILKQEKKSMFSEARKAGARVAVAGFYLPYCRLFGAALDYCFFLGASDYDYRTSITKNIRNIFHRTFHLKDRNNTELYSRLLFRAKELVADPQYQFVFIHWPIPHLPGVADSHGNTIHVPRYDSVEPEYIDNLKLADNTLREIRLVMEQAGRWDQDHVIVTSDHSIHWYRPWIKDAKHRDDRIPFMVKLAGSDRDLKSREVKGRYETINLNSLIVSLLKDELGEERNILSVH
jgi:hypothetical protein